MQLQLLIAALSCSSIAMAQKSFTEDELKSLINAMTTTTAAPSASPSGTVSGTASLPTLSATSAPLSASPSATPFSTPPAAGAGANAGEARNALASAGMGSLSIGLLLFGLLA